MRPGNWSRPGQSGSQGVCWCPIATMTCWAVSGPVDVDTRQPSASGSIRSTWTPNRTFRSCRRAKDSR